VEREKKRLGVFAKYLPKIAKFSTDLAGREKEPDIQRLIESVSVVGGKEKEE
jgi:type VI protein secretion system component VasA